MTAGADTTIILTAGVSPGGTALTEADLASVLPTTTITVDGDVTSLNSLIGTGALHTTVCTGPVMSSWVYRRPVAGNNHLVVYAEVRLFKGGEVEIFPWIENGYLQVAGPTNFVRTCVVTIDGAQRFGQSIDIKHHTRVPLVSGSAFSHWTGVDPGITPRHDRTYLLATKLIPNLSWNDPSSATLDALQQSYSPNTTAGDTNPTGGTGGSGCILSGSSALYVTSGGDARAYRALITHGLSSGTWSCHYRDETTNRPIAFAAYPNISLNGWSNSPSVPAASGGTVPGAGSGAISHLSSFAYFPFLVTGRWWFLDEMHFWATFVYMWNNPAFRAKPGGTGADGIIDSAHGYTVRGMAWALNCCAQAATATPSAHPLASQFVASWQNTTENLVNKYITGTVAGGAYRNVLGVLGYYSGASDLSTPWPPPKSTGAWWDAMYQHNYVATVLGYTSDIGIPQSSASLANHISARNFSYKLVIGRADDGMQGRYNWRRFICFAAPIGTDGTGMPIETYFTTFGQMYAGLVAGYSLASIPADVGLTLKQHSSDADLTNSDSSRAYGSTALAALAMAVEHGQPNALEGWRRVTGASNFVSSFTGYLTNEAPNFGILPRTM